MSAANFHKKPFDEGTLTKLQIFELYSREWLPVFLSPERPRRSEVHLFDFFAGPGTDVAGELGSPLRLLRQLKQYGGMAGWPNVDLTVHFSDSSPSKIRRLKTNIQSHQLALPNVTFDIRSLKFEDAIRSCEATLANPQAAKLLFIDQSGVEHVTPQIFQRLVGSPACDFLFFLSSSTLYRFRDHPAIKQKITRPGDYYQVHQAALDYYRSLLPSPEYFLAPFSIKKGPNIYGIIFGSKHALGMDKFLQVAWKEDEINGEADFDINRDNLPIGQMVLLPDVFRPSKITAFERALEQLLREGCLKNELDVVRVCFTHGVRRQQAQSVIAKLKAEGVIEADFRVPQLKGARPVIMIS